ncbi:hypothetical protein [Lysobacter antibioticus]|uniref:hypothetical protein n=1 Tax=Lysobacter antibioticus TaxID=84531 RepID=UPI001269CAD1|nr:hypothetical protein [Lysobacter antibioticus]
MADPGPNLRTRDCMSRDVLFSLMWFVAATASPFAMAQQGAETESRSAAVAAAEAAAEAAEAARAHATAAADASNVLASRRTVPKLNIRWDCGECEHNDKVPPLIEQAYVEQANERWLNVSETDVADVAIIDIRQRPPGVRVMFGIMAGRDRLGLRVRHAGKEFEVSDTSSNIVMGLNHLSASVGKSVFEELAAAKEN